MLSIFFRNPRLLILTLATIALAGVSAYQVLPRQEDPRLTKRAMFILTEYPGAGAEQVESLVTEKIEEELEEIEEIFLIKSSSRTGISVIAVEVSEYISPEETRKALSKIRDKAGDAEAKLPEGALSPVINETDTEVDAYTIIVSLVWNGEVRSAGPVVDPEASGIPYAVLRRHADTLAARLRSMNGTKQVALFGAPSEEVVAEVDAAALVQLGLSAPEVARLVASQDSKVPAGQLRGSSAELLVEVEGKFDTLERIGRTPVAAGDDGQLLLLRDIATLRKMAADPPAEIASISGRPGVVVAVRMEPGLRIDRWASEIRAALDDYAALLPRGVELRTIFDQSGYVEERIGSLQTNLLIGMGLVMAVILFTMGWRSALLIGSALPLVSLAVLWLLQALGVPLHQMSITGLVIALGLLIDNAIVIVDEVTWRLRQGGPPLKAVQGSINHLAIPLASSTFTTVLAFMPIVMVPGGAGEFIGPIAVSVILAVISSLAISLTIIPAITARVKPGESSERRDAWWRNGIQNERARKLYGQSLAWLFAKPGRGVALAAALPLAGFLTFSQLDEQFFPPSDRDQFQVQLRLPQQTSLDRTRQAASEARETMLAHPNVTEVHWFAGSNAPKFYYNMLGGDDGSAFYAQALVQLRGRENYFETIREIQDTLDRRFPEAQFIARQLEQGPPFDAPIEVHVQGPDLERLREIGDRLRAELASVPEVVHTRATLADGRPKLWLETDDEEVRLAGLDKVTIAGQMQGMFEGVLAGSLIEGTEELPVRIRVARGSRGNFSTLASLDVLLPTAEGAEPEAAPLDSLGRLQLVPELSNIPHRNGLRTNTVQGFLTAGTLPSVVLEQFEDRLADITLPPGYAWELGGEASERNSAVSQLMASVGVLVLLAISAVVLTFNSFRMALIILSVGGLAVGSGLTVLWLFNYPFGFVAIMGIMGLIGISINDSIVVLAQLRERKPQSPRAAGEVVIRSSRHVFSTTLTTIAGFTPLLLGGGGLWPPLVVAISGGVVGGTLLALVFVPSVYLLVSQEQRVRRPALREVAPVAAAAGLVLLLALAASGAQGDGAAESEPGRLESGGLALHQSAGNAPATEDTGDSQRRRLTLRDAVELAMKLNPGIQIANLRVLESQGVYGQVRAGYLPQVSIQSGMSSQTANLGSAGLQFPGIPRRIGPYESFDARPVFEQTILDLALVRRMEAARHRIRQAQWDAASLREATILAVVQLYLATLEADSRFKATEARLETARTLLEQSKDYLEAGTANRLDYSRAAVQFQRETAALAEAGQAVESNRFLLQQTIGVQVDGDLELTASFELDRYESPRADDAIRRAMATRPEVEALDAKFEAAEKDLAAVKLQRAPRLGFRADYGISAESLTRGVSTWSYGARLEMPLITGGRIGAEVAENALWLRQVDQERQELRLRIQSEVRTALVKLNAAWTSAHAATKAASAAREALDLAQARFGAGLTNNLDVVQAQESRAEAENFAFESLFRYHLARANLARAMGDVTSFL